MSLRSFNPPSLDDDGVWDLSEIEDKAIKPTQWAAVGSRIYKGVSSTHPKLPSGAYMITLDRGTDEVLFIRKDVKTDTIIRFKDSVADKIVSEIDTFWTTGDKFKKLGFLHRRGYLLYGQQGCGKSSIVQQVIVDVVNRDGVVFICENPKFFNKALSVFRQAEPHRNLVCVFEDIDAIIKRYGEDEILAILDGTNMVDRVLNVATTNYPEMLDKRIVSRPRRFDRIMKIELPDEAVRREFISSKVKAKEVARWVERTKGLSLAGVAEAIISVECLGNPIDDTIKILVDVENGHPSSEDFGKKKGKLGFKDDDDDEED